METLRSFVEMLRLSLETARSFVETARSFVETPRDIKEVAGLILETLPLIVEIARSFLESRQTFLYFTLPSFERFPGSGIVIKLLRSSPSRFVCPPCLPLRDLFGDNPFFHKTKPPRDSTKHE